MEKIKGIPFGFKNSWFVFMTGDLENLKQQLLQYFRIVRTDTVENGLKEGWNGGWCLSGPVSNMVFLISSEGYQFREKAKLLSKAIGEVHFYATHRGSEYLVCSKFIHGETIRDFSIGDGEINFNIGEPTEIELAIGSREKEDKLNSCKDDQPMYNYNSNLEPLAYLGSERTLMEIAGNWSLDPSKLDQYEIENTCSILQLKK